MDKVDSLQGIGDMEGEFKGPPPVGENFEMPSMKEMLEALEKLDLSDVDKEKLKDSLLMRSKMDEDVMTNFLKPAFEILPAGNPLMNYVIFVSFLIVITLFVFFGYKLYKSLTEKERRREERRKQKQMKKKK